MKQIIFINFLICFLFYKTTYSEEKNFNSEKHKEKLIEKKLLLNSFKKYEEYINETSVELFLNCSDKNFYVRKNDTQPRLLVVLKTILL